MTEQQNKDFAIDLGLDTIPVRQLDNAILWIQEHLNPNEVFSASKLRDWVFENSDPEDIFSVSELQTWAWNHGFTKDGF